MLHSAEPLDHANLLARVEAGWAPKFVFFWGHSGRPGADVGKECLSQWFPASFIVAGEVYPTAEHYMMASKAELFGDTGTASQIRACSHPAEAKELGRHVRGFDDDLWRQHRFDIVATGSHAKFSQNPTLRAFLLSTGERVLVEVSPKDTIWGVGLGEEDPRARSPQEWRGLNLLGFALMHARARILREGRELEP
jgi:ribA/ribD-fused uncharacterized protein